MSDLQKKLGQVLQLERQRQNISFDDLSVKLKISETNLRCIEEGDPSGLPLELYFNLFAKSYCEALGIDYNATVEAIELDLACQESDDLSQSGNLPDRVEAGGEESHDGEIDHDRPQTKQFKKLLMAFGGVVVLFILFVMVMKFLQGDSPESKLSAGMSLLESEQAASQGKHADEDITGFDWTVPAYQPPQPLKLGLTAREESWATVMADGDTVIFRNLIVGRTYRVEAKYRLQISVGIPRVVDIKVNGREVNLADRTSGRISRVRITQMNVNNLFSQPLPPVTNPAESNIRNDNDQTTKKQS